MVSMVRDDNMGRPLPRAAARRAERCVQWARDLRRIGQTRPAVEPLPKHVTLRDLSLANPLTCFGAPVGVSFQCDWILIAYATGLLDIEVGAYPAEDAPARTSEIDEVIAFAMTLQDLRVGVSVRDAGCARRALGQGVSRVTVPLATSRCFAGAVVEQSIPALLKELRAVCRARDEAGTGALIEARIAIDLGGNEGEFDAAKTQSLAQGALDAGCNVISLSGAFGRAAPAQTLQIFGQVRSLAAKTPISVHLIGNDGLDLANVLAALRAGATLLDVRFSATGQAESANAQGSVPAIGMAMMLDAQGVETGVDLRTLRELPDFAARHRALPG